jgi:hypothetical protein
VVLKAHQRPAQVAGTMVLIGALTCTFLPVRQRFESSFLDDEVSEEMQVSDFLNHTVPAATMLYSNFNYPVFAYYTNLPVHRLPESGPALYDVLNHLPSNGILIAYKENDVVADPRLEWRSAEPTISSSLKAVRLNWTDFQFNQAKSLPSAVNGL